MKALIKFDEDASVPEPAGTIPLCPHMGCAFKCCDFQQTGTILLHPGEIEQAIAEGRSVAHLEILDAHYHGGKRAKCRASDTRSCDQGYKPLDCASYPFFPVVLPEHSDTSGAPMLVVKDGICPIHSSEIPYHKQYVAGMWRELLQNNPTVEPWLKSIFPDNFRPDDTDFGELF